MPFPNPFRRNPRVELAGVVESLVQLLAQHGEREKAEWLAVRLTILKRDGATDDEMKLTRAELHHVVLGMDGLLDLHLEATAEEPRVNQRLSGLADRLHQLTK